MKTMILSLVLSALMVFSGAGITEDTVQIWNLSDGTLGVSELDGRRGYAFSSGDQVVMGRIRPDGETVAATVELPGGSGVIRFVSDSGDWVETPLAAGTYTASTVEIVQDGGTFFCYLPKTYEVGERQTLTYLPEADGFLTVAAAGDGWTVTLTARGEEGTVADYTWMRASDPLLDWFYGSDPENWYNYTQDGAGKWCYDGYYRTTPDTYVPTGPNGLYRCPASYVVQSMVEAAADRQSARSLALAMADTLIRGQNDLGYWETGPESQWLSTDYGIGPGFYDTRFNTELADLCGALYRLTGGDFLRDALERYCDFYLSMAEAHHRETASGGWLVEDYWGSDAAAPVHTSLNHLLAECLAAYHLAEILDRADLREAADRMLLAVEDTAPDWINGEGNLHYRCNSDGTYGGSDYPYLTYNDLLALQQYLVASGRGPSEALTYLMDAKRAWMDANGVTEYNHESV